MVDGRMRKFFEEVALLSQAFVINPDLTVEAAVKEAEKTVGAPIEVTGMARLAARRGRREGRNRLCRRSCGRRQGLISSS